MVMLHIQLKGMTKYKSKEIYFARRPLHDPRTPSSTPWGWGQKVIIQPFFSEHGHVVYRIKEIHKCSNMLAYFAR